MLEKFTRTHLTLGRVFGIPVGLNYSWFAVFVIVLWTLSTGYFPQVAPAAAPWTLRLVSVIASLAFFASILAHEFGHALAARHSGIEVRGVTLFVLGGVSRIASEPRTAGEELYIAAAGPLVSVGLAVLGYATAVFAPKTAVMTALLAYVVLVNLALAAFNLVPALPLDGGRVLRALIWAVTGDAHRATRYCAWAGRTAGVAMALSGLVASFLGGVLLGFWLIVIGLFIERSARSSAIAAASAELEALSLQRVPAGLHTCTGTWELLAPVLAEGAGTGDRYMRGTHMGVEERYHDLLERVVTWRARLDVLPRPGEMSADDASLASAHGAQYQEARMRMFDLLNEIDVHVRSRLDESDIQARFAALSALYEEWKPGEEVESDLAEDDPGDAILAGRPESFAPTPEEFLTREPGSSAEV